MCAEFSKLLKKVIVKTVAMFKHATIYNKIIVKFFLEEFKIDFCKVSLLMPPNHCLTLK